MRENLEHPKIKWEKRQRRAKRVVVTYRARTHLAPTPNADLIEDLLPAHRVRRWELAILHVKNRLSQKTEYVARKEVVQECKVSAKD
jgi:hypothetical protein